jgi:hypothetical protein
VQRPVFDRDDILSGHEAVANIRREAGSRPYRETSPAPAHRSAPLRGTGAEASGLPHGAAGRCPARPDPSGTRCRDACPRRPDHERRDRAPCARTPCPAGDSRPRRAPVRPSACHNCASGGDISRTEGGRSSPAGRCTPRPIRPPATAPSKPRGPRPSPGQPAGHRRAPPRGPTAPSHRRNRPALSWRRPPPPDPLDPPPTVPHTQPDPPRHGTARHGTARHGTDPTDREPGELRLTAARAP